MMIGWSISCLYSAAAFISASETTFFSFLTVLLSFTAFFWFVISTYLTSFTTRTVYSPVKLCF